MSEKNPLDGIFGIAETQMGPEAYAASVAHQEACTLAVLADAERLRAKASLFKNLTGLSALSALVLLLPVAIWVWKWALS